MLFVKYNMKRQSTINIMICSIIRIVKCFDLKVLKKDIQAQPMPIKLANANTYQYSRRGKNNFQNNQAGQAARASNSRINKKIKAAKRLFFII